MDKYYIFSDESGSWSNKSDEFYVRSWVKVKEQDYLYLEGLWKNKKFPKPTCASLIKNSAGISDELNKLEFKYFFTFTRLEEFYSRKFYVRDKIIENVSLAISQLESRIKSYMKNKIPNKIKDAINQILFLHVYEAYHIENSIRNLCISNEIYEFYLDKPQFAGDDYLEVFTNQMGNLGINGKLIFSSKENSGGNNTGIYYADALASLSLNLLKNNGGDEAIKYFKENIVPKSISGNIGIAGLNKIFYPVNKSYGSDELRQKERQFISKIITKMNL